jgi:hypothetical protein
MFTLVIALTAPPTSRMRLLRLFMAAPLPRTVYSTPDTVMLPPVNPTSSQMQC